MSASAAKAAVVDAARDTMAKIEADKQALDALLEDVGGEVTPETEAAIEQWFRELEDRTTEKVDGYGFTIRMALADAEKFTAAADELYAKARTAESRAKYAKARMAQHMTEQGLDRLAGNIYTFAFQKNGGVAPLVLASENPDDFPEDCRITTVTLNKERIRERLEAGDESLPAAVGERGRSLRLR